MEDIVNNYDDNFSEKDYDSNEDEDNITDKLTYSLIFKPYSTNDELNIMNVSKINFA